MTIGEFLLMVGIGIVVGYAIWIATTGKNWSKW